MQSFNVESDKFPVGNLLPGMVCSITLCEHNLIQKLELLRVDGEFLFFKGNARTRERILYLSACYIHQGIPREHVTIHLN